MPTTPKGYPFPDGNSSNDVPAHFEALAGFIDTRPGIAILTTTERDALTGAELWEGRTVYNATTMRHDLYENGTWRPVSREPVTETFTVSGSWIKPDKATHHVVDVWGGGGSGSTGGGSYGPGAGGGGGGHQRFRALSTDLLESITITVGAGGNPSTVFGTSGGDSGFGSFVTASGGVGGRAEVGTGPGKGGAGGGNSAGHAPTAADREFEANSSEGGAAGGGSYPAGSSDWGGGGGGDHLGTGGSSVHAGRGGDGATTGAGNAQNGTTPGGGGGGSSTGAAGAGARGEVRVTTYF